MKSLAMVITSCRRQPAAAEHSRRQPRCVSQPTRSIEDQTGQPAAISTAESRKRPRPSATAMDWKAAVRGTTSSVAQPASTATQPASQAEPSAPATAPVAMTRSTTSTTSAGDDQDKLGQDAVRFRVG